MVAFLHRGNGHSRYICACCHHGIGDNGWNWWWRRSSPSNIASPLLWTERGHSPLRFFDLYLRRDTLHHYLGLAPPREENECSPRLRSRLSYDADRPHGLIYRCVVQYHASRLGNPGDPRTSALFPHFPGGYQGHGGVQEGEQGLQGESSRVEEVRRRVSVKKGEGNHS